MTLVEILILLCLSITISFVSSNYLRKWLLFILSVIAIFLLQPSSSIQYLSYWLPTFTLFIVILSWLIITPVENRNWSDNISTITALIIIVVLISLARYFSVFRLITSTRPPQPWLVLIVIFAMAIGYLIVNQMKSLNIPKSYIVTGLILSVFVVLKYPPLTTLVSSGLRILTQQSADLARASDIQWLGYSYLAFRILHTIRDKQTGIIHYVNLQEYFVYVLFYPAVTAGPIDRLPRFIENLRQTTKLSPENFTEGGKRLVIGLFKKFVLADSLSMVALNATSANQVSGTGWMWILVYAYSFQIFFDFSGYTDIAIGLGRFVGIILPENFNRPYLRSNLTLFWNEWHKTLTQWFRAYFFFPLTRALRQSSNRIPAWGIIFITQLSTMTLIGLWHGLTWNFLLWGLWHGIGLFIQNRWSGWINPITDAWKGNNPWRNLIIKGIGVIITFHYVALGWVWFALPNVNMSLVAYKTLFGF